MIYYKTYCILIFEEGGKVIMSKDEVEQKNRVGMDNKIGKLGYVNIGIINFILMNNQKKDCLDNQKKDCFKMILNKIKKYFIKK